MEESLTYAVSHVVDVDRNALSPEGGVAMDFSETNTEDSDSNYPDDLVPSQLFLFPCKIATFYATK